MAKSALTAHPLQVMAVAVYAKGALPGSNKDWYYGQLSRVQAEHALAVFGQHCFLVRENQGDLVLSLLHHGQLHHVNIKYGPGWYELENGSAQYSFTGLEELVDHYRETAISDTLKVTLGAVCGKAGESVGEGCRCSGNKLLHRCSGPL